MAGSYLHVTNPDLSFRGTDLIDNLGDAYEALEEMHDMIRYMADRLTPDDPRRAIHEAHRYGHVGVRHPYNVDESFMSFDAFVRDLSE